MSKRLPNAFQNSEKIEEDFYRTRKQARYQSIQSCCGLCVLLMFGIAILINLNVFISAVIPYLPRLGFGEAMGLVLLFGIVWLALKYIVFRGINRNKQD